MNAMTLDGTPRARSRRGGGLRGKAARRRKHQLVQAANAARQARKQTWRGFCAEQINRRSDT